ncbi:MAG: outer membrane protein [Fibrobacterota bacterium]
MNFLKPTVCSLITILSILFCGTVASAEDRRETVPSWAAAAVDENAVDTVPPWTGAVGVFGGYPAVGGQLLFLKDYVWGGRVRGYAAYAHGTSWTEAARGLSGSFCFYYPRQQQFRPYVTLGGGLEWVTVDTSLVSGTSEQDAAILYPLSAAAGLEYRPKEHREHAFSLEVGYCYGRKQFSSSSSEIGENTVSVQRSTYTPVPFRISLVYSFDPVQRDTTEEDPENELIFEADSL